MTAKPDTERRREADARKRDSGLIRVSVWVRKENKAKLQELARKLEQPSK